MELISSKPAPCQVVGDCISLGVASGLKVCRPDTKVGIASQAIIGRVRPGYELTVLSTGSNNLPWATPRQRWPAILKQVEHDAEAARARATGRVIWIVPNHPALHALIIAIAERHGDQILTFQAGGDRVHPRSYTPLIRAISPLIISQR